MYADPWVMPAKGVRDVSIRGLNVDPRMLCVTGKRISKLAVVIQMQLLVAPENLARVQANLQFGRN